MSNVTITVRRERVSDVTFALSKDAATGAAVVSANGAPVVRFTKDGYLQRVKSLPSSTGLRRLDDGTGRVAIRAKRNGRRNGRV